MSLLVNRAARRFFAFQGKQLHADSSTTLRSVGCGSWNIGSNWTGEKGDEFPSSSTGVARKRRIASSAYSPGSSCFKSLCSGSFDTTKQTSSSNTSVFVTNGYGSRSLASPLILRNHSSIAQQPEVSDDEIDQDTFTREEMVYDEPNTKTLIKARENVPSQSATKRPKLAALREQLSKEKISNDPKNGVVPVSKFVNTARKKEAVEKDSTKPPTLEMEEMRRWAQSLPEISDSSLVLTDRYQRKHTYLRLSLTERCNLRCTYCMPENGVPLQPQSHLLQTDELLQLASYFRQQGVTKFRLTGGEPTLRSDLKDIVHGLQALNPTQIGMTTNGIVLASKLQGLVDAGLSSVNLSLDTLQEDKFARLTRRPATYLHKVWQSLEACEDLLASRPGHTFKLNCVVMRHVNTDEIADFVRLTQKFPNLLVRFIEYMPFTKNGWNNEQLVPYQELLQQLRDENDMDLVQVASTDPSDTTKWYKTPWSDPQEGARIGFITSMSNHFCGTCNRLRLTADGQLKVCLFDGKTELSLRDALRAGFSDNELSKVIHAAVQQKHFKLGGHVDPKALAADVDTNRPMTLIGG